MFSNIVTFVLIVYFLTVFGIFYLLRGVHYLNNLFSAPNDVIWSKRKDGILHSLVSRTFTFLVCFQFQSPSDICWGKAIDMYKKISLLILGTFFTSIFVLNECVSTLFFLLTSVKVLHVWVNTCLTILSINIIDLGVLNSGRRSEKDARNYLNWHRKDKSLILLSILKNSDVFIDSRMRPFFTGRFSVKNILYSFISYHFISLNILFKFICELFTSTLYIIFYFIQKQYCIVKFFWWGQYNYGFTDLMRVYIWTEDKVRGWYTLIRSRKPCIDRYKNAKTVSLQ